MKCTRCNDDLDQEEIDSPRQNKDDEIICDECFYELYGHLCPICEEMFCEDLSEKISPKHIIISKEAEDDLRIVAGIYEIIKYPFFANGMIEFDLYPDSLKKISNIPNNAIEDNIRNSICYICEGCIKN